MFLFQYGIGYLTEMRLEYLLQLSYVFRRNEKNLP